MSDVFITLQPRTFWGKRYYPADDADTQIAMLREQLAILWQENEELHQQQEFVPAALALNDELQDEKAKNAELHNSLSELELRCANALAQVSELQALKAENADMRQKLGELETQLADNQSQTTADEAALLHEQLVQLVAQNEDLRKQCQSIEQADASVKTLSQENAELRQKLAALETERDSRRLSSAEADELIKENAERDAARINRLTQTIDSLKREISEYEKLTSNSIVEQASAKADRILSRAMQESERIMAEAVKQRDSVIAASRSAYYNALQFKMNLAACMSNTERDLDDAIETLRLLKYPTDGTDMLISMSNEPKD